MGHGYCEGSWENKGDTYVLTSFDQYRNPKEFTVASNSITNNKKQTRSKESKYELDLSAVGQNVQVKFPDTSNVYFDKVIFRLKASTLVRFDEKGNMTDSKFTKPLTSNF